MDKTSARQIYGKMRCCIFFLLSIGILISCSNNDKSSKNPNLSARAEKINAIYQKYIYEKNICQKFVESIEADRDTVSKIEELDYNERKNRVGGILSKSIAAKSEAVQYLLRNLGYFVIDVDYHGGAGMIYVKNSPVFCAYEVHKRLKELEAFGPSEKSWEVRKNFLDLFLEQVGMSGMPGYEGPVWFDFESLRKEFDETKRIYTGQTER
ncbi:MAG: hypothetical protein HY957_10130, partial [Nitrospirae bacterium]|nr:hypothetical protein [Nitrospirota bacterium]